MAAPMFYCPAPKWHVWAALSAAVFIHAAAVAIAGMSTTPPPAPAAAPKPDVIIEILDPPPPETAEPPPPEIAAPPPPQIDDAFIEETVTPPPPRQHVDRAPQRLVKAAPAAARMSFGAAKVFAITAPRPEYPYEARRQRATGSGVALLAIDAGTGSVTDVRMLRSTGNPVLDNATISGLRRWRFRPGTVSIVQTPITYTLTGAAF